MSGTTFFVIAALSAAALLLSVSVVISATREFREDASGYLKSFFGF